MSSTCSTPWVLARWNGQCYQRMGRFPSLEEAWIHKKTYELAMKRRGRKVRMSAWCEVPSMDWFQQELLALSDEYDSSPSDERRQEIRVEVSKRLDDLYWFATAYRIPLDSFDIPLGLELLTNVA